MVDYRGPELLRALCKRYNIDIFDRVVDLEYGEIHPALYENVEKLKSLNKVIWVHNFMASYAAELESLQVKFPDHFRILTDRQGIQSYNTKFVLQFIPQAVEDTDLRGDVLTLSEYKRLIAIANKQNAAFNIASANAVKANTTTKAPNSAVANTAVPNTGSANTQTEPIDVFGLRDQLLQQIADSNE